jgi:hypothetical protein
MVFSTLQNVFGGGAFSFLSTDAFTSVAKLTLLCILLSGSYLLGHATKTTASMKATVQDVTEKVLNTDAADTGGSTIKTTVTSKSGAAGENCNDAKVEPVEVEASLESLINPRLSAKSLPQNILDAEYAVRGEIVMLAQKIQAEITAKPKNHGYPFEKTVACNIGNPQAVGMDTDY